METFIDLKKRYAREQKLSKAIGAAETVVTKLKSKQKSLHAKLSKEIGTALEAGCTTGCPFTDESFWLFGLDKQKLDNALAFNKRLVEGKGQLLAFAFNCKKQTDSHHRAGSHKQSKYGFIFLIGILSGDRIAFIRQKKHLPLIVLPFTRSVTWSNVDRKMGFKVCSGPMYLDLLHARRNKFGLDSILIKVGIETGTILCPDIRERFCLIGTEVCGNTMLNAGNRLPHMSINLDGALEALHGSVSGEVPAGADA